MKQTHPFQILKKCTEINGIKLIRFVYHCYYKTVNFTLFMLKSFFVSYKKKSCIRETPNLTTNAERRTNIFFVEQKTTTKFPICNDSSFLRLYEWVHKCASPPVEHLQRVNLPWVQSATTPCFKGSMSWSTSAPVH